MVTGSIGKDWKSDPGEFDPTPPPYKEPTMKEAVLKSIQYHATEIDKLNKKLEILAKYGIEDLPASALDTGPF